MSLQQAITRLEVIAQREVEKSNAINIKIDDIQYWLRQLDPKDWVYHISDTAVLKWENGKIAYQLETPESSIYGFLVDLPIKIKEIIYNEHLEHFINQVVEGY